MYAPFFNRVSNRNSFKSINSYNHTHKPNYYTLLAANLDEMKAEEEIPKFILKTQIDLSRLAQEEEEMVPKPKGKGKDLSPKELLKKKTKLKTWRHKKA